MSVPLSERKCTVPVAKDLTGALYLEVFLDELGGLVVEKTVRVLFPRRDFELETG